MTLDRPILIAGSGSVGRRHLRNLRSLGHKKIILYRTGNSTLPDDEIADIPQVFDLHEALAQNPIATIVVNPTALHMHVALSAAKAGSHLFLEKPISHTMDGVDELRRIVKRQHLIVQVGFQFRFHPLLRRVKRLLDKGVIGRIVSVQAHWGDYMPGWHPWEDYRKSYSARLALGGGVILTLCHPFDYLRWLIGEVTAVSAITSRNGLNLDVEDSSDVLLQFTTGAIGTVHLDYLEQQGQHFVRIIGQRGMIHWDNTEGALRWYSRSKGKWESTFVPAHFERNTMFVDEMRYFITRMKRNEQPLCTLEDGIRNLQIVLAAKESAKKGRLITLR